MEGGQRVGGSSSFINAGISPASCCSCLTGPQSRGKMASLAFS